MGELSADRTHYWDTDDWEPLWLRPDEVAAAVHRRYGLAAESVTLLADGLLNQSWRVDGPGGALVVRVSRAERTREQVGYEHEFLRRLRGRFDFIVPALSGVDGETVQTFRGRTLSAFPFIAGTPGTAVDAGLLGRNAAEILARLHRASLDGLGLPQRPGLRCVDEHPRWIWHAIRPVLAAAHVGSAELFAVFDRQVADLDAWLDDLLGSGRPLPRASIHGDLNPRNLLLGDDGRIRAVIDWDECRVDLLAWEVAQVGFGSPDLPVAEFWERYLAAGGPLPADDLYLLGGFARIGALSELRYAVDDGKPGRRVEPLLRTVADGLTWLQGREADLHRSRSPRPDRRRIQVNDRS